jgi:coenzyme PQQ precursor peptide PqqA
VEFERRRIAVLDPDFLVANPALHSLPRTKIIPLNEEKNPLPGDDRPFIPAGGEGGGALLSALGGNTMKIWNKPQVREQEVGLEVTSYLPAEIDII